MRKLVVQTTVLAMVLVIHPTAVAVVIEQTATATDWGLFPPLQYPDYPVQSFLAAGPWLSEFVFTELERQASSGCHYTLVVLDDDNGEPGNVIYQSELYLLDTLPQPFELAVRPPVLIPTTVSTPYYVGLRPDASDTGGLIVRGGLGDPYTDGMFTLIGRWHDADPQFAHDFDAAFRATFVPEPVTFLPLVLGALGLLRTRRA